MVEDLFTPYETGLTRLLEQLGQDHPRYTEALTLESRVEENIHGARRYGDTEARRAERAQIVDALNALAIAALDVEFNALCEVAGRSEPTGSGMTSATEPGVTIGGNVSDSIIITGRGNVVNTGGQTIFVESRPATEESSPIPWHEVKRTCQENSRYYLDLMKPKYDARLYVEREILKYHVDRFIESDEARYLVLNGQSGVGKTGFLYELEKRLRRRDEIACFICDCNALDVTDEACTVPLFDCLAKGILPKSATHGFDTLLNRIEMAESLEHQRLVIIVDAINENKDMDAIVHTIRDLHHGKPRSWVRVIISCRPHVWPQVSTKIRLPRGEGGYMIPDRYFYRPRDAQDLYVAVTGFDEQEAEEAYNKYQQCYKFQPETFSELDPISQQRLRDPLRLLMVSVRCANRRITEEDTRSDISVIPAYTNCLLERAVKDNEARKPIISFLEKTLPRLMVDDKRNCHNSVNRERISPDDSTSLAILLGTAILEENATGQIHFRYERFYDYYFAPHIRRFLSEGDGLDCRPTKD